MPSALFRRIMVVKLGNSKQTVANVIETNVHAKTHLRREDHAVAVEPDDLRRLKVAHDEHLAILHLLQRVMFP